MRLKYIACILALLTLLSCGAVYAAVSEVVRPVPAAVTLFTIPVGDASEDGQVNAIDITKVERIIVGLDDPSPAADANLDGIINAVDITKVERIIAGLD